MAYEKPYRAEMTSVRLPDGSCGVGGDIFLMGEGRIGTTKSYMEARRLVDLANLAVELAESGEGR